MNCRMGNKQAVRAVLRRRSGIVEEDCISVLERINATLDELVLTLQHLNWKAGAPLESALSRLSQRAGSTWDRESRLMVVKDQAKPYFHFGQAAILAALCVLVLGGLEDC
jgi:hypothetical protein